MFGLPHPFLQASQQCLTVAPMHPVQQKDYVQGRGKGPEPTAYFGKMFEDRAATRLPAEVGGDSRLAGRMQRQWMESSHPASNKGWIHAERDEFLISSKGCQLG